MPQSLRIHGLNTAVELTFPEETPAAFVDAVARAWSRCLAPAGNGPRHAEPLIVRPPHDDSTDATDAALQSLTQQVTYHLIAAQSGHLLLFHAGAVSHPDSGRSLVFVAPGGTGKTTLARTLAKDYGYLTDETVGMEASGLIHPYPKPLSLRRGATCSKREASPDELGLLPAHPTPVLARVVLLRRNAGPSAAPVLEELGTLDAVGTLLAETSALNRFPQPLQTLARLLEATGPVVRLIYSDAADLLPVAADLIAGNS